MVQVLASELETLEHLLETGRARGNLREYIGKGESLGRKENVVVASAIIAVKETVKVYDEAVVRTSLESQSKFPPTVHFIYSITCRQIFSFPSVKFELHKCISALTKTSLEASAGISRELREDKLEDVNMEFDRMKILVFVKSLQSVSDQNNAMPAYLVSEMDFSGNLGHRLS